MGQFHIHHSTGPDQFQEIVNQPRKYAGYVEAESIEGAFRAAQNTEELWNPFQPCRSTSVGDVIQDGDQFYMVLGMGFKCLTKEL